MKRISEVWSNTCELIQPPLLHGDTTIIGTRMPKPYGPVGAPGRPAKISLMVLTVDLPCPANGGVGGTMWSKKPPSSSYVRKSTVLLNTSGWAARMSITCEVYHAP